LLNPTGIKSIFNFIGKIFYQLLKPKKMKKLFVVALLALGLNGFAQESKQNWSEKKVEKMTIELSLTADQQKLLMPLFDEQKKLYDDIKASPDTKDANKAKIREVAKKMEAILTPEQIVLQKSLKVKKQD
jgi:periplasmic protein CpxP/Spy